MTVLQQLLLMENDCSHSKERFQEKHDPRYPFNAVNYVLEQSNFDLNNIDRVFLKTILKFERLLETYMFCPKRI